MIIQIIQVYFLRMILIKMTDQAKFRLYEIKKIDHYFINEIILSKIIQ